MAEPTCLYLSDIFRHTEALGLKGHQIGRKIGDALELVAYGAVASNHALTKYLVVEPKVVGASGAGHKVEFSFYCLDASGVPDHDDPDAVFGLIECKKVGVEQTVSQAFKNWGDKSRPFHATGGFQMSFNGDRVRVAAASLDGKTALDITVDDETYTFGVSEDDRIALIRGYFGDESSVLGPDEHLTTVKDKMRSCTIIHVVAIDAQGVSKILVEQCLTGPQTPEKAKQASFVSLDVRKRVTGTFDKSSATEARFFSALVIGEASHWEEKSRNMVRLANDRNVMVPDDVVIELIEQMQRAYPGDYLDKISKREYEVNPKVKTIVDDVIAARGGRVFQDLDTGAFVRFGIVEGERPRLVVEELV